MTLIEHRPYAGTPTDPTTATEPLLPTVGQDLRVPVLGGGHVRYANFDWAATAPALQVAADAATTALTTYGSVHRGAGLPSQASTARYEAARAAVGAFSGARPGEDAVVFTRNTTDALNLLASAVPSGGEVLVLDVEHHANLLPWTARPHRCLEAPPTVEGTLAAVEAALRERPVALLAVTGASNVTGEVLPLRRLVRLAHAAGARVALDAAQLAPHRPLDLAGTGVDYVAFSGHKLYAPFGAGALVGRRDWLDAAPPFLLGGGAVRDVRADGTDWLPAPQRHEGGTPNLLGAVALAAACDALCVLPAGVLEAHEAALRTRLLDGLRTIAGVRTHRIWDDGRDAIGVVCFSVEGFAPGHVGAYLSAEHGIGVRDGRFCAHRLLTRLGLPGGALRASLGVGSTAADVDRLLFALRELVAGHAHAGYAEGERGWAPVDDDRDLGAWVPDGGPAPAGCRA
ncbi:aminotransferase class V-fold PLP-dependent enzyme [Paraconexibacter antarcticus]|uniref:Aminotransferase class V-fold PLP-dependent enzyme n=1 Tax=Paraconexibacter antarcticus TaxID=2949664 RepID=A0ABY5DND7_9ACTN|nr:aminotransferase class V-fold PLP-dependent enzyme [Paraconexibacter antarcticus]UTI62356.1 aminotransferase class V-fold PLP-dependent enzyme [Paraconexibacter antarcticus]